MHNDSLPPGKDVLLEVHDQEIHIIFESEIDAIEMMPQGPSVFERRKNVIVMIANHPLAKQLREDMYHEAA